MPELTYRERIQPSLLDRLTDELPGAKTEPRASRIISSERLRQCVVRDLEWLLNTVNLGSLEDLDRYPCARVSVLNYGMPDIAGRTASGIDPEAVAAQLRAAIVAYEPRLIAQTVRVTAESATGFNTVRFQIEALLWSQPMPLKLFLQTEFDLEQGHVRLDDAPGSDQPQPPAP